MHFRFLFILALISGCGCPAQAALTAYWPFDADYHSTENNTLYEGMPQGGSFIGISMAAEEHVRGAGALRLNSGPSSGNGTFIDVGNPVISDGQPEVTLTAWYKFQDISGDGSDTRNVILETTPDYTASFSLRFSETTFRRDAEWFWKPTEPGTPTDYRNTEGPVVEDGQWHHAALIWNATRQWIKYYHDGALCSVYSLVGKSRGLARSEGFHIGNHRTGDGTRDFDGYIDDVAIFNVELRADQVRALFEGTCSPLTVESLPVPGPDTPLLDPMPFIPGSWSLAIFPDIQKYSQLEEFTPVLDSMSKWVCDNREARSIQALLLEGDITNNNAELVGIQWLRARHGLFHLNDQLPYVLVTGNHDYGPTGDSSSRFTMLNTFFSVADNSRNDPTQGGVLVAMKTGHELQNAAYAFTAPDGRKFLVLALEWGPRQESVDWANQIVSQPVYADHTAIVVTHAYLYNDNTRYDWATRGSQQSGNPHTYSGTSADTHDGEELWQELIRSNPIIRFVFCGHVIGSTPRTERSGAGFLTSVNDEGFPVHQVLFNAQFLDHGGDGWLRLVEFAPGGSVQIKTFSPYRQLRGENPWRVMPYDQFSFQIDASGGEGGIEGEIPGLHSADLDHDFTIGLSELLVMVQFFNSAGFHCDANGEGGYAPGPGDTNCAPYNGDYNTQDWHISLSELLRVIQFFNSNGYHYCPEEGTEDNYCPGLA